MVVQATSGRGLGWIVAAFFIVADMVGGGIVAMPVAFLETGLTVGITFMVVITIFFAYTAYLLSQNWIIMQQRWPVYQNHCRKPYPEMAMRSMGKTMKTISARIVYLTMFGTSVVFILLSSKIFQHFLASFFGINISLCYLICITTIAIMPLTYLKSPADFWLAIVIAMLCTVLAVLLIALGISLDISACISEAHYPKTSVGGAVVSLGTFLFAFSGHQVFPTIQHDMYRPIDFPKSITLGFCIVAFLYMPLSVYGYLTYGSSMHSSIIDSVQTSWIRHAANLTIAIHCILALIIMVNPLNQQAEHLFNAPHSFGIQRVLIRTGVLGTILFCALTIPDFGPFMNLVGALTNPPTCVVLPALTNLYLNAMSIDEKTRDYKIPTFPEVIRRTDIKKLLWNGFIIVIALVAGIVSAYLAIQEILTVHFTPPCYLRPLFAQTATILHNEKINCCGMKQNIYVFGNATEMCQLSQQTLL
uniref:Aa_trans domain-containing protein n=3 Tax=Loa loa TaxID=7209 RepID=A0A1I7VDN0_LOALO